MKKIIAFTMLLIISVTSFSQQIKPAPALAKQDYQNKSKSQKSAAWLLLGGGTAVLTITALSNLGICIGPGCTKKTFPVVSVGLGGAAIVSSIPFFIASSQNKKKAMSLSLKNVVAPNISNNNFVYRQIPSLNLKISL